MIKITQESDLTLITSSVSEFADALGYCEYKIPLSISGVKPKPSQALIQGTMAHSEKEKQEAEEVEFEPVTMDELEDKFHDVEFARETIFTTLNVPFNFEKQNVLVSLSGRTDKILRKEETLIVSDDKFTGDPRSYDSKPQPYPSQLLQVLVYLNSIYSSSKTRHPEDLFEMPHTQKMWQIRICDRMTRTPYKIYSDYQDSFALQFLHNSLQRFATVSLGIEEPTHHNSVNKCNACNLKSFCEFRIK
jgi:hypothetical protein